MIINLPFRYKCTLFASLHIPYTLFVNHALSDKLDRPFYDLDNTLPVNSIANIIERDICAAIGQPLPKLIKPINFILK